MKSTIYQKSGVQAILSIATILTGTILMIFMMVVESEPGAVPLFLILSGAVWYFIIRKKRGIKLR